MQIQVDEGRRKHCGVRAPYRMIEVGGVGLAVADRGSGMPVVCLHAIAHGGGDFAGLEDRFGRRFRFVTLDWPGQGHSGDDPQPASASRYAQLLEAVLDRLGIGDAVLLGNSIGGAAALQYAATHPGRVRGLVLANSGGLAPVDLMSRLFCAAMSRFFAAGVRRPGWYQRAFGAYYRGILREPGAIEQRDRIVAAGYETAAVLAQAWSSFGQPNADLRRLIPQVTCPVLCTWARDDRIVSFARSRAAIARFPNCRAEMFSGGHSAFLEDAPAFDLAFASFLGSLAPAAAA